MTLDTDVEDIHKFTKTPQLRHSQLPVTAYRRLNPAASHYPRIPTNSTMTILQSQGPLPPFPALSILNVGVRNARRGACSVLSHSESCVGLSCYVLHTTRLCSYVLYTTTGPSQPCKKPHAIFLSHLSLSHAPDESEPPCPGAHSPSVSRRNAAASRLRGWILRRCVPILAPHHGGTSISTSLFACSCRKAGGRVAGGSAAPAGPAAVSVVAISLDLSLSPSRSASLPKCASASCALALRAAPAQTP